MIKDRFKYTLLLTSLPRHPSSLFNAQQPPISRIQLDKRLRLLSESDAKDLANIEALLHWSKAVEATDDVIVKKYNTQIQSIHNDFLKEQISWRLELRTILSALRRRKAEETLTPNSIFHGFGKWPLLIKRHGHEKDLGIGHLHPWIMEANALLEQNQTLELEKLLLNLVWQHYARTENGHYFDFEAVVLYVLRWDVLNRWSSYDKQRAVIRFDELVKAGLADVALDF